MARRDYRDLFRQMEQDMQRFTEEAFVSFFDTPGSYKRFWQPAADVHETTEGIVIKLELAGVTTENVNVSLSGNGRRLVVSGTRSEEDKEREGRIGCHQLEIYFGPFERTFILSEDHNIDREQISATLRDGFLTIMLPKRERPLLQERNIPISVEE